MLLFVLVLSCRGKMKNSEGVLISLSSDCPVHMLFATRLRDAVWLRDAVYGSGQVKDTTVIRRENPSSSEVYRRLRRLSIRGSDLAIVALVLSGIKRYGRQQKVNVQTSYSAAGRTAPTTHVMSHCLPGRASQAKYDKGKSTSAHKSPSHELHRQTRHRGEAIRASCQAQGRPLGAAVEGPAHCHPPTIWHLGQTRAECRPSPPVTADTAGRWAARGTNDDV